MKLIDAAFKKGSEISLNGKGINDTEMKYLLSKETHKVDKLYLSK